MEHKDLSIANAKRSAGVDLTDEALSSAWRAVQENSLTYVAVLLTSNKASLHSSGTSLDELIASLNDDNVFYGALIAHVCDQRKVYTFFIVGANVGGMARGKASMNKSGVLNYFESHGEISFSDGVSSVTRATVIEKLQAVTRQKDSDIIII